MRRQYTIAEARDHLARIVQEVEAGEEVELILDGKPVAMLVLACNPEGASSDPTGFIEALEKFRREHDLDELWAEGDPFEGVRDRSPGREFN